MVLSYPPMFEGGILFLVGHLKSARGSESLLKPLGCWVFSFCNETFELENRITFTSGYEAFICRSYKVARHSIVEGSY